MLSAALEDLKDAPEEMHFERLRKTGIILNRRLKNGYSSFIQKFGKIDPQFQISRNEFILIIDKLTSKVLCEFIDLSDNDPWFDTLSK